MPNHITNILKASKNVLDAFKGPERLVDFNAIKPMPQILQHTSSGSREFDGVRYNNWWHPINQKNVFNDEGERPFTPEELEELSKLDHSDWYSWSCAHWGTKWNAYDVSEIEGGIQFDTAWSCPIPIIKELVNRFPDERIELLYADEDIGSNMGHLIFKNGDVTEKHIADPILFALRVKNEEDSEYYRPNPETGLFEYFDAEEES